MRMTPRDDASQAPAEAVDELDEDAASDFGTRGYVRELAVTFVEQVRSGHRDLHSRPRPKAIAKIEARVRRDSGRRSFGDITCREIQFAMRGEVERGAQSHAAFGIATPLRRE